MKKVNILLATYNGETYLQEQLESLINQDYENIDIYVRDDGSCDNTISIISEYCDKYSNIILLDSDKRAGYPECFYKILIASKQADYYAFCDQDDVWLPDKITRAVNQLEKSDYNQPLLYYAAVDYYDADLNFIRSSAFARRAKGKSQNYGLQQFILGGEPLGMTYVFNEFNRQILENVYNSGIKDMKDIFLKVFTAASGKIHYDPIPCAKYRRHEKATSVDTNPASLVQRYIKLFKDYFINNKILNVNSKDIAYVWSEYNYLVHYENKKLLELFSDKSNITYRIRKFFWPKRFRKSLPEELAFRFFFLIGKI